MYTPPAFRIADLADLHAAMREARAATLVTATTEGLIGTPLPTLIEPGEGEFGTLYAHVARANVQWKLPPVGEAMAIFHGPQAYITPSWYPTKAETHKVVPTWNYVAIHAYGPVEFFEEADRLLSIVSRLTDVHEAGRSLQWRVTDAPADFIASQLKGIVGVRMPITRLDGKRKMSQNRNAADREGVIAGLSAGDRPDDRAVAKMVPLG